MYAVNGKYGTVLNNYGRFYQMRSGDLAMNESYRVAGIDVHKSMLAVVVTDVAGGPDHPARRHEACGVSGFRQCLWIAPRIAPKGQVSTVLTFRSPPGLSLRAFGPRKLMQTRADAAEW